MVIIFIPVLVMIQTVVYTISWLFATHMYARAIVLGHQLWKHTEAFIYSTNM